MLKQKNGCDLPSVSHWGDGPAASTAQDERGAALAGAHLRSGRALLAPGTLAAGTPEVTGARGRLLLAARAPTASSQQDLATHLFHVERGGRQRHGSHRSPSFVDTLCQVLILMWGNQNF